MKTWNKHMILSNSISDPLADMQEKIQSIERAGGTTKDEVDQLKKQLHQHEMKYQIRFPYMHELINDIKILR